MSGANLHSRSRKKKDGFEIPLVEVSSIDVKLLRKKCCAQEISRAVLGSGNNLWLACVSIYVQKPSQSMFQRWRAPEVATRPHRVLATGNKMLQPHIVKSTVALNATRSDVNDVGG